MESRPLTVPVSFIAAPAVLVAVGVAATVSFIAAPAVLVAVGVAATLLPARRAARLDPLRALRID